MKVMFASVMLALAPMMLPQAPANDASKGASQHAVIMSVNRLSTESTEGKAANQKLQQLAQKMAGELSTREKDATTKPDDLQKFRQQAQNDFNTAQRQMQNELRAKFGPVITEIALQHGADLVLNADSAVVWGAQKLDITNEVIAKLNEAPK